MTAYWIVTYDEVSDPDRVAAYAALAAPAIVAAGGRFLVRGQPAEVHELGERTRTVVVEFASVEAAEAAYASGPYVEALEALGDGARRDLRIVPGVDQV